MWTKPLDKGRMCRAASVTANGDFFVLLSYGLRTRCAYQVIRQTGGCGSKEGGEKRNSFVKFSSLTENQLAILKENHSLTVLQCSTLISSVPARQTTTKIFFFKSLQAASL